MPTPTSGRPISAPVSVRAFPVKGWDRYEILEFLGAGGMGRVFKARDPRLNRYVALKLIRDDNPEHVQRLLREAQAQAQIEHENICKVYEVGEVEGHPFIAMQYIAGESLKEAKSWLSLQQTIEVIRRVAHALHAAHRIGIIHRDIKPANIMLERGEDGALHPFVMDFGLAREVSSDRLSITGTVEGTPAYMAPEQAAGGAHQLDRRTDIYSLGVTLYEMLCGRPPFLGTSSVQILMAVMHQEPAPIRSLYKGVPADLEMIVMKCLEKEATYRYDSAKALAEDLQRYADGDPVQARPSGLGYRLGKWAKKHKALVALAVVALVSTALFGGAWIRARLSAAEQARLSQQLGEDVTQMETFMRLTYLLPLHDTRPERSMIRERMEGIEREMVKLTTLGVGPGHYAIGRGHLALHEHEEAVFHLEAAYRAGYAGPDVAQALGQALGGVWRSAVDDAQQIGDQDRRNKRIKEAEAEYLEPALRHLRESAGSRGQVRPYVEGLIALYEKKYDEALRKAREAFAGAPWLYEAKTIEGEARFAEGREAHDKADYTGALAHYREAIKSLQLASTIARSDAYVHNAEADIWLEIMEAEGRLGTSPRGSLEEALAALERSLSATPGVSAPHSKKALALFRMGLYQTLINEDPSAHLNRGLEAANEAVRLNPKDALAFNSMGSLHITRANYLMSLGKDPRPWFDRAAESLRQALEVNPSSNWAWNDLQIVATMSAVYELSRGLDPQKSVDRAVDMYNRAIASDSTYAVPHSNISYAISIQAQYELMHGRDPRPGVRRALLAGRTSTAIWPGFYSAYTNMSLAYLLQSHYELDIGVAPLESAERAIENASEAIKLNPKSMEAQRYAAEAYQVKALYAFSLGEDPGESLRFARRHLDASAAVSPAEPLAARVRAVVELTAARWEIRNGRAPNEALDRARAAINLSLAGSPNDAETLQVSADIHRVQAERPGRSLQEIAIDVREGRAAVEKALSVNPRLSRAMATQGALYLVKARVEPSAQGRREEARGAVAALEQALRENENKKRELGPILDEARRLSEEAQRRR